MSSSQATTSIVASREPSSKKADDLRIQHINSLRLRPEDAYLKSPPLVSRSRSPLARSDTVTTASAGLSEARKRRDRRRGRSSSRKGTRPWKKLLWVKQSYPDNYTDEETFLDHLQINQRLRPYEFWPLVADSTIIVQHVCSVVIFVCCFVAIFQERVSPTTVVGWATFGTVASWVSRDYWQSHEHEENEPPTRSSAESPVDSDNALRIMSLPRNASPPRGSLGSRPHSRAPSLTSSIPRPVITEPITTPYEVTSALSPRMLERLTTAKSAILIYFSLLGLSPILKSLTKSTSSDSIWALSTWLMCINVFTFDYGAGPEAKFPASLSTNAALMASTVLASRLPSTTHVFSLTLFSIEVFGLFPVFRRHLKHHSWMLHLWLTVFLVVLASGGLSMIISGGGWGYAVLGVVLGGLGTCLSMGMTSWWLIGLQRYKNEIHGPWDPARPVIRRHWD
ncbi:hypothetical protein AMS68_004338 [Peltaster fructicola]|uniref:GPI2-domain-containing protein n=1 Tax=Peltaster fructicola TaxID=286661 RepID=A0A6H0XVY2_9PEZI|nr:hypothetical protein AMS68_004338 [Peltaster fructicola]